MATSKKIKHFIQSKTGIKFISAYIPYLTNRFYNKKIECKTLFTNIYHILSNLFAAQLPQHGIQLLDAFSYIVIATKIDKIIDLINLSQTCWTNLSYFAIFLL